MSKRWYVVHAYSGAEVLQKVAKSRPDILLMDVLLGDADGRDLCRRLRSNAATRHIPIVLISAAKTEEEDQVSGLRGGADDYLVKPVEREILLAKLEAVQREKQFRNKIERQKSQDLQDAARELDAILADDEDALDLLMANYDAEADLLLAVFGLGRLI